MEALPWHLQEQLARLQVDRLRAIVDPGQPQQGLAEISVGADRLSGARLLGIATDSSSAGEETLGVENHVRGADFVSSYKESPNRPVRFEARWRAITPTPEEGCLGAVELLVSVQTHVLDGRAELSVRSGLSVSETLRLLDPESLGYQPLDPRSVGPITLQPQQGPGCLLFRLPGVDLSYAEMVHPADFRRGQLSSGPEQHGAIRLSHQLFPERLEKGVLLRARLQGVFLPRRQDVSIAAACYSAFAAAEPPLST